jgi:hypothetical protein
MYKSPALNIQVDIHAHKIDGRYRFYMYQCNHLGQESVRAISREDTEQHWVDDVECSLNAEILHNIYKINTEWDCEMRWHVWSYSDTDCKKCGEMKRNVHPDEW